MDASADSTRWHHQPNPTSELQVEGRHHFRGLESPVHNNAFMSDTAQFDEVDTTWSSNVQSSTQRSQILLDDKQLARPRTVSLDAGQESGIGSDSDSAIDTGLVANTSDTDLNLTQMFDLSLSAPPQTTSFTVQYPVTVFGESARVPSDKWTSDGHNVRNRVDQSDSSSQLTVTEFPSSSSKKANSTTQSHSRQLPAVPVDNGVYKNDDHSPGGARSPWQRVHGTGATGGGLPDMNGADGSSFHAQDSVITDSGFDIDVWTDELSTTYRQTEQLLSDEATGLHNFSAISYKHNAGLPHSGWGSITNTRHVMETSLTASDVWTNSLSSDTSTLRSNASRKHHTSSAVVGSETVGRNEQLVARNIVDGSIKRAAEDTNGFLPINERSRPPRSLSVNAEVAEHYQQRIQHFSVKNRKSSLELHPNSSLHTSVNQSSSNSMALPAFRGYNGSDMTQSFMDDGVPPEHSFLPVGTRLASNTTSIQLGGMQRVDGRAGEDRFDTFQGEFPATSRRFESTSSQQYLRSHENFIGSVNGDRSQVLRRHNEAVSKERHHSQRHSFVELGHGHQRTYQTQHSADSGRPHQSNHALNGWGRQMSADQYPDADRQWSHLQITDDPVSGNDEDEMWKKNLRRQCQQRYRLENGATPSGQNEQHFFDGQGQSSLNSGSTISQSAEVRRPSSVPLSEAYSTRHVSDTRDLTSILKRHAHILTFSGHVTTDPAIQRPTVQRHVTGPLQVQSPRSDSASISVLNHGSLSSARRVSADAAPSSARSVSEMTSPVGTPDPQNTSSLQRPKSQSKTSSYIKRWFSSKSSKKDAQKSSTANPRKLPATPIPRYEQREVDVSPRNNTTSGAYQPRQVENQLETSVTNDVFTNSHMSLDTPASPTSGATTFSMLSLPWQFRTVKQNVDRRVVDDMNSPAASKQTHMLDWDRSNRDNIDVSILLSNYERTPLPSRVSCARSPGSNPRVMVNRGKMTERFKTTSFMHSVSSDSQKMPEPSLTCDNDRTSSVIPPSKSWLTTVTRNESSQKQSPLKKTLAKLLTRNSRPSSLRLKMPNHIVIEPKSNMDLVSENPEDDIIPDFSSRVSSSGNSHAARRLRYDSSSDDLSSTASALPDTPSTTDSAGLDPHATDYGRFGFPGNLPPHHSERSLSGSTWSSGSNQSTPTKMSNIFNSVLYTPSATPTRASLVPPTLCDTDALNSTRSLMNHHELSIAFNQYSGFIGYREAIDDVNRLIDNMSENGDVFSAAATVDVQNDEVQDSREIVERDCRTEGINNGYDEVKAKLGTAVRCFVIECKQLVAVAMAFSMDTSSKQVKFDFLVTDTVRCFIILLARCRHALSTIAIQQAAPLSDALKIVANGYSEMLNVAVEMMSRESIDKVLVKQLKMRADKLAEAFRQLMLNIKLIKREIAYF